MEFIKDFKLLEYTTLNSTQQYCKALIQNGAAEHGLVIRAHEQTNGHGRDGSSWLSSGSQNIAITIILDISNINKDLSSQSQLSIIAAVAVGNTILKYDSSAPIHYKWPNDVMFGEATNLKKISGILCEQVGDNKILIGIGINIASYPTDIALEQSDTIKSRSYSATSLNAEDILITSGECLEDLLNELQKLCNSWAAVGFEKSGILEQYSKIALYIGKEVQLNSAGTIYSGKFIGIDKNGCLMLENADKNINHIISGQFI